MVRKYIKRDFTDHKYTTQYIGDDDEYIKLEIFSYDPICTQKYIPFDNSLTGENCLKTTFRSVSCLQSKDKVNPMEFTLNYKVEEAGLYRVDLLYEKNSLMYGTSVENAPYNTDKDLVGWYDVYLSGSKEEHKAKVSKKTKVVNPKNMNGIDVKTRKAFESVLKKSGLLIDNMDKYIVEKDLANVNLTGKPNSASNLLFDGVNNALKRKTLYLDLNKGDWKFEFGVPSNCYVMGAIVRKVITFWGTNTDEAGSNLQFTNAKYTNSDMSKPSELEATIGFDDDLEYYPNRSGLYLSYMDECNLYVKNNEDNIERVFGGYISTPLLNEDRTEITIHGADRLKDGENRYILDQLLLQNGDSNEVEYENSVSFNTYAELLKYLCKIYEVSLVNSVQYDSSVEDEMYKEGFHVTYGKNKDISGKKKKKVTVDNGQVTYNKNSVTLRNNSSGKKKQVWTVYDAKKVSQKPFNLSRLDFYDEQGNHETCNLHITYGLGNPKTEHKIKEKKLVDVSGSTAGSQSFGKCGVSADKKLVMGIGCRSSSKDPKQYKYGDYYRVIFKNKCPHCGKATLRWDSCRSDTKCIYTQNWKGSKGSWGVPAVETEITCTNCDSDFSIFGNEKDKPWKKLTKVGSVKKSSKAEQTKLHKGKLSALPKSNVKVSADDIFKAVKNACKGYRYERGTYSTASELEKHKRGDCWAWSEKIGKELSRYKVNWKIVEYTTSQADNHRSVLYQNSKGEYVDFPYREYNFPMNTRNTSGSKHGHVISSDKTGGRINQATVKGNTTKTQTVTTTVTEGYDKENPFQAYIDICYSTENSFSAKKYHIYVDFTQKANSKYAMTGLEPVWVNNASKRITLEDVVGRIRDYRGNVDVYLHSISFIAPKIKTSTSDKKVEWYANDENTKDNSSCKMNLHEISFDNRSSVQPAKLESCGKTVNELIQSIVEKTGYIVDLDYGLHRCDDKINFKLNVNNDAVFTATEGDNNNILEWSNISFDPANQLFNNSVCVFKKNTTNKYYYVNSSNMESILDYGEQTTLITETEGIGEKQAYWNARHNEKFNPEQAYTFTVTVKGFPDVHLKEFVEVIANASKLNTLKECESIVLTYDIKDKPVIQTELGLGELAPDLLVGKIIKGLRDNAKAKRTDFGSSATPINDSSVYEWDN